MKIYTVSEIEVACLALNAIWVKVPSEDQVADMQRAGGSAIRIIATGLAEIEAEHTRANAEPKR